MKLDAPKQVKTLETKERIYKATDDILKKKGFAYLTVTNICKVAGVSNGTFFYHFKTKDDLLSYYIFDKFAEYRIKTGFSSKVADLPFDSRIIQYYSQWATYMNEIGIEFFTSFYHTKNRCLDVRRFDKRVPSAMWNYPITCLEEAKENGLIKDEIPVLHISEVLATIMKGVAFDWCLSEDAFDMGDRIEEVMRPYLNSIQKNK